MFEYADVWHRHCESHSHFTFFFLVENVFSLVAFTIIIIICQRRLHAFFFFFLFGVFLVFFFFFFKFYASPCKCIEGVKMLTLSCAPLRHVPTACNFLFWLQKWIHLLLQQSSTVHFFKDCE